MSDDIAIKVEGLSKCYHIYDTPRDRLKQFVLPRLQRATGVVLKRYFREFWALKNVSLEVKKGETVGIIGRNGSGKSTLLQMICGTLNPTCGSIRTNGRIAALLELGSGFNPEFTGRENVYLNSAVLGLSKEETDQRFEEIAAFADIGDFIEQPVKTYSSGMLVRLAFAVAINVDPDVLIVDEALSVGDELFQRKCFSRIESIKEKGSSILFVSHSASTINQLCDNALLLEKGELILHGEPREITKRYHQLIFAKPDVENDVIASIREDGFAGNVASEEENNQILFSDYIDGLSVTKPLRYQRHGGEILSCEIMDASASRVNFVTTGFAGLVKLIVKFDKNFEDVVFGFHLKTTNGLEVAGLSYPSLKKPPIPVASGETVEVVWNVTMPLVAGTYLLTCGVRSLSDGGFIDRIVDGRVLKVIEKPNSSAFGLFDISNPSQSIMRRF